MFITLPRERVLLVEFDSKMFSYESDVFLRYVTLSLPFIRVVNCSTSSSRSNTFLNSFKQSNKGNLLDLIVRSTIGKNGRKSFRKFFNISRNILTILSRDIGITSIYFIRMLITFGICCANEGNLIIFSMKINISSSFALIFNNTLLLLSLLLLLLD